MPEPLHSESHHPTSYCATAPNQVWSWDVSYLPSLIRGEYYYLYLIVDIFSRKIVGWEVHECEHGDYAAALVHKATLKESVVKQQLVLHADNDSLQKGSTLRLQDDNRSSEQLRLIPIFKCFNALKKEAE